ncbi:hypothetical protein H7F33_15975 [Pedobacter sp. PAMC26386]|nr:hypothetical protein H7F33_15975 [Pedobacter sp. PAMC26386]
MLHFVKKHLSVTLLTFCGLLLPSLLDAQENKFTGVYEYVKNETFMHFYLSPSRRFAFILEDGKTNLEIRGKYNTKGDSVYLEQDKTAQTFFDIYGTYNPAIPVGKRTIYNYLPQSANTMYSINKTYRISALSTPGLKDEDGNWTKKEITLKKGDKLWLYTTDNPHQIEEYILPDSFNEFDIVSDLYPASQFKLSRKIKAVLNTHKELVTELSPGSEAFLFKFIADPMNAEDHQKLEKPLPIKPLHTKNLNYTTIRVNRQFEDKNTKTLIITDEDPPKSE